VIGADSDGLALLGERSLHSFSVRDLSAPYSSDTRDSGMLAAEPTKSSGRISQLTGIRGLDISILDDPRHRRKALGLPSAETKIQETCSLELVQPWILLVNALKWINTSSLPAKSCAKETLRSRL
jgi:hypothetical protein